LETNLPVPPVTPILITGWNINAKRTTVETLCLMIDYTKNTLHLQGKI
jgi:hypothetical protein